MIPPQDVVTFRLECLKLAVQTAIASGDRSAENVENIATRYYNAVVGTPQTSQGKKDKSAKPDPLS